MADKRIEGVPEWALTELRRLGYSPRNCMDEHIRAWWSWYQADNGFYRPDRHDSPGMGCPERHLTLRPARMACDEWAGLTMDEKTRVTSEDPEFAEWLQGRFGRFVGREADHLALTFALGTGAYVVGLDGVRADDEGRTAPSTDARATIDFVDAGGVVPLETSRGESVSCAFVTQVDAGGRLLQQLQVHAPGESGYEIRTLLYEPGREDRGPVEAPEVAPLVATGSPLPTYALLRPAIANTYADNTPLGVSVYDDAVDAIKCVDEAFDSMFWSLRLCQPRVIVDEQAIVYRKDGRPDLADTVDARIYKSLRGGVGQQVPVTVYAPDMRSEEYERVLNDALSMFGAKCGFGSNYFSFTRQAGLKTATEVVADSAALYRSLRKHEQAIGEGFERLFRGAYAAERAVRGLSVPEDLPFEVVWDDSVAEDTDSERATMKDDIARGLCPAWLYPVTYYGMPEDEARALVGDTAYLAPEE